jgi:hypothetical protein
MAGLKVSPWYLYAWLIVAYAIANIPTNNHRGMTTSLGWRPISRLVEDGVNQIPTAEYDRNTDQKGQE